MKGAALGSRHENALRVMGRSRRPISFGLIVARAVAPPGAAARAADEKARAFPGAEGFAAYARRGTGGRRIGVTSRADPRREGRLRWALAQTGRRIVDFQVGGCFELDLSLPVSEPFLTLESSTAPEPVMLKDGALHHQWHPRHHRATPAGPDR
jgi:hypothetical protein